MAQSSKNVSHGLKVHLVGAVEDVARYGQSTGQILGRFSLSRPSRSSRRTAKVQLEAHGEGDVASIGEGGDDEPASIADPLVKVLAVVVADPNVDVRADLIPFEPQLLLPGEGSRTLRLVSNELVDHIAGVNVHGNERDDLGPIGSRQVSHHQLDEGR